MTQMPLKSYRGSLPPLSDQQEDIEQRLSTHVQYLAETLGERNLSRAGSLQVAADYLRTNLEQAGYIVAGQEYSVAGQTVRNLEVQLGGNDNPSETIVVGAHDDSVPRAPGVNDNASGVAGVLELAAYSMESKPTNKSDWCSSLTRNHRTSRPTK